MSSSPSLFLDREKIFLSIFSYPFNILNTSISSPLNLLVSTLETRRLRGDQIEVFKILNGYENIERNIFFAQAKKREGLEDMELH